MFLVLEFVLGNMEKIDPQMVKDMVKNEILEH